MKDETMFIGLGAMKSGTTWLHDYLSSHNEVLASPIKEMNFFTSYLHHDKYPHIASGFLRRYAEMSSARHISPQSIVKFKNLADRVAMELDPSLYVDFFRSRLDAQTVFGEISPSYADLDSTDFSFMSSIHENVKFIFILRDPVERFISHVKYNKKLNPRLNLDEVLRAALDKDSLFMLRSRYDRTIRELESVVDSKNIHYMFYEDMFCDSEIKKLCSFLAIDYKVADFNSFSNKNTEVKDDIWTESVLVDIAEQLSHTYKFCYEKFGGQIPGQWVNHG